MPPDGSTSMSTGSPAEPALDGPTIDVSVAVPFMVTAS